MRDLLLDPRVFNFVIMMLYGVNSIRWLVAGSWADCGYWAFALGITACVTWGYQR